MLKKEVTMLFFHYKMVQLMRFELMSRLSTYVVVPDSDM